MDVSIVNFDKKYRSYFQSLNEEWLNKYYFITESDLLLLSNPEKLISEGGFVFFALMNTDVVGTCALIPHGEFCFEIIKMAVSEHVQNFGIGSLLMKKCIAFAEKNDANKITLETAVPLKAAIHLYKKFGFLQTSEEYTHPVFTRTTFLMELKLK